MLSLDSQYILSADQYETTYKHIENSHIARCIVLNHLLPKMTRLITEYDDAAWQVALIGVEACRSLFSHTRRTHRGAAHSI